MALEERLSIGELQSLIESVMSGKRTIGGHEIWFASSVRGEEGKLDALTHPWSHLSAQLSSAQMPDPLVNGHHFRLGGSACREALQRVRGGHDAVDEELRRASRPTDGVAHLIKSHGATLGGWTADVGMIFDVVAPLGIALDVSRCELRDERVRISVVAATKVAARMATVALPTDEKRGRSIRDRVKLARAEWKGAGGPLTLELEHTLGGVEHAVLLLQMNGQTVQRVELPRRVGRLNALTAAYALHVPNDDQRWRKCLLQSEGKDADEFHDAVTRLFGMVGLGVIHVGGKRETLDLLACVGREYLLTVECTTSTLKGEGKMEKLIRRTQELRDGLRMRGVAVADRIVRSDDTRSMQLSGRKQYGPVSVIGVMASSMPQETLSKSACREAAMDGIVVLGREDLRELLRVAELDVDHLEEVRTLILSRVDYPLHAEPREDKLGWINRELARGRRL